MNELRYTLIIREMKPEAAMAFSNKVAGLQKKEHFSAKDVLTKHFGIDFTTELRNYFWEFPSELSDISVFKYAVGVEVVTADYKWTETRFGQPVEGTVVDFIVVGR
ncbi:hypothetical protein JFI80_03515 [Enterococcus faecium]|uniref:hypothetical protein n=1 Tax=Enterococcus faecium TaxID=1352 RepID=UPI001A1FB6FA|nr:hypothetical protein [Enterococcus faecium]EMF0353964.1 hypothetical protein [Enterococcus faecium]MBK1310258.1 hypothetical protein [Enterococcus faecium]MDW7854065.1 hypothetical protein [Enterococcus faecium]